MHQWGILITSIHFTRYRPNLRGEHGVTASTGSSAIFVILNGTIHREIGASEVLRVTARVCKALVLPLTSGEPVRARSAPRLNERV
jgi:hypothetical protein